MAPAAIVEILCARRRDRARPVEVGGVARVGVLVEVLSAVGRPAAVRTLEEESVAIRGLDVRAAAGGEPFPPERRELDGHEVAFSNPDKVYFPERGHTKLDLVRYYLAVADGAAVVALFELPNAHGGYLDLVMAIVTETIADVLNAGGNVSNAQSALHEANAAKAAGNFKAAYSLYRKAYKAAGR